MSALSAAASDEDGDTISALRAENEQLRQSLLTANDTLQKVARAGACHAQAAECLRETVIRWANRAEQAEDMLEAIGAGGVGKLGQPDDTALQEAAKQARDWIAERPDRRPVSAGRMVATLTNALAAAPQPPKSTTSVSSCANCQEPQVEQEPAATVSINVIGSRTTVDLEWSDLLPALPAGSHQLYTHPQNLRCKSTQARLATLWGYEKPQPKREPLTEMEIVKLRQLTPGTLDVQFVKFAHAIERAHGITGENT